MKRVILFENGSEVNGKVFMVTHSVDELLKAASAKFNIIAKRIFTPQGGEIDDIKLIRDDDILYVSIGEDFIRKDNNILSRNHEWVTLNVGGKLFSTTRSTLTHKEPMSMLARMFMKKEDSSQFRISPSKQDSSGAFLIDRSSTYFEPLLNYLRHGQLILDNNVSPAGVLEEARFYGFDGIIGILEEMVNEGNKKQKGTEALNRRDILKAIMSTPAASELRFQGVNLAGADLSRLDLRNINFKYANLRGCNLVGANLSGCCLERADMSFANLENAQLVCVKMVCANLEAANLHSCNFEDPSGAPANMEGVNLKGANLEGSNMASVNLRVATLKNGILKNCDLRSAVLAGADLESCDLSGSDLHDANLRGANLKNAAFELMQTPLHMSQTISEVELRKIVCDDKILQKAYNELNSFYWLENELIAYKHEMKRIRDEQAVLAQKLDDAEQKGIIEGKIEVAKNLLKAGVSVDLIAQCTNLPKAEISKLKEEIF